MKSVWAILALGVAATAQAQSSPYQGMPTPQFGYAGSIGSVDDVTGSAAKASETEPLRGSLETPTMRRQQLARAIALRDDAVRLQAADGGTLSPAHARAIHRRARAILAGRSTLPGTLFAARD